jgi:hypothetical protein
LHWTTSLRLSRTPMPAAGVTRGCGRFRGRGTCTS